MPVAAVINESDFSSEARKRLRNPSCRGSFRPLDAARRQLGLLSASDDRGQTRFYCLVNLESKVIEDARFLAFGDLSSHPVADALTELMRNQGLEQALTINAEAVEKLLRGEQEHSFAGQQQAFEFIPSLQKNLAASFPSVKLLPKPVEKEVYARKREADWSDADKIWFPMSLLKKIGALQKCIKNLLLNKLKRDDFTWSIEGLHDDFRIVIKISDIAAEEKPTLLRFMEEALHENIHSGLSVEEYNS
ncbi:MAG: iron-sulfur cluster assembly scaffold protein [Planctomycetes bacterium]|nr:iron-sulfur cluster assembly scaffold protein [Planctomycetota bacterium]